MYGESVVDKVPTTIKIIPVIFVALSLITCVDNIAGNGYVLAMVRLKRGNLLIIN